MDTIRLYLSAVTSRPVLQPEEEVRLTRILQAGMQETPAVLPREIATLGPLHEYLKQLPPRAIWAYRRLIEANTRLVISEAKKHVPKNSVLTLDDVCQYGMIGLALGILRFNPDQEYRLSTYVYAWIRQTIQRSVSQTVHTVRLSVRNNFILAKYMKVQDEYLFEHGRYPDTATALKLLHESDSDITITLETLENILTAARTPCSYDRSFSEEGGKKTTLLEVLDTTKHSPDYHNSQECLELLELWKEIRYFIELNYDDMDLSLQIVEMAYLHDMPYAEIAKAVNIEHRVVRRHLAEVRRKYIAIAERIEGRNETAQKIWREQRQNRLKLA